MNLWYLLLGLFKLIILVTWKNCFYWFIKHTHTHTHTTPTTATITTKRTQVRGGKKELENSRPVLFLALVSKTKTHKTQMLYWSKNNYLWSMQAGVKYYSKTSSGFAFSQGHSRLLIWKTPVLTKSSSTKMLWCRQVWGWLAFEKRYGNKKISSQVKGSKSHLVHQVNRPGFRQMAFQERVSANQSWEVALGV